MKAEKKFKKSKCKIIFLLLIIFISPCTRAQVDADSNNIPSNKLIDSLFKTIDQLKKEYEILSSSNVEEKNGDFIFWEGEDSVMSFQKIASMCAPIFWYSSDEPELNGKIGKEINIPSPFPFETAGANKFSRPVVYYQIPFFDRKTIKNGKEENYYPPEYLGRAFNINTKIEKSTVNLFNINELEIDYIHFYNNEVGAGKHKYDTEMVEFYIEVKSKRKEGKKIYKLLLNKVVGKAHGYKYYDNIYERGKEHKDRIKIPFSILVEDGKHASCTDANGDGYYTPGFDVNCFTNDAWGVRDVIRSGKIITPDYQGWMTKIRTRQYRVMPELPDASPHKKKFIIGGEYCPLNSVYELRTMPTLKDVKGKHLKNDIRDYLKENWPYNNSDEGDFEFILESINPAFRYDKFFGISMALGPFQAPLTDGWLVPKFSIGFGNPGYENFSLLYTTSTSRFFDPYFSVGINLINVEYGETVTDSLFRFKPIPGIPIITPYYPLSGSEIISQGKVDVSFEFGFKFRMNTKYTIFPFTLLRHIKDFWGIRLGIKNTGIKINDLNFIAEIGVGEF